MIHLLPILVLGSLGFFATKRSKKSAPKKSRYSNFKVIESGSVMRLPKVPSPALSMKLKVGEAIRIETMDSRAVIWKVTRLGMSVRMDRGMRQQDSLTSIITFTFNAVEAGTTLATFEKVNRRGETTESRRLEINVE